LQKLHLASETGGPGPPRLAGVLRARYIQRVTTPATDRTWLRAWIQPRHLDAESVERGRATFGGDALHLLTVPDFFLPDIADRTAAFLETEAVFTQQYAILRGEDPSEDHEELVPEPEFLSAPMERRFLRFGVGPGRPVRMSVAWMRYLSLRAAIHDRRFAEYVEELTGLALGPVSSLSAHAMGAGDFLAPHNDTNLQRRLAFICYFSKGWRADLGGSLLVTGMDDEVTTVVPDFNRLVLFDVDAHKTHRVEAIACSAGTSRRLSLGGWFGRPGSDGIEPGHD
jgi:Rps23 Pro-64 3,4-dihydroxylase Tpa1-like proline 4-hydroxylase